MYATYTTRAIVCGSKDSYTSDRSYLLFTEEAGMLWASARSVRTEISKQRFALVDFSIIRVSLVKGRSGWRIGSVEALGNPFLAARSRSDRALITNLVRTIRRYVHGEEPLRPVFTDLINTVQKLPDCDKESLVPLQLIFTTRLLYQLGYIHKSAGLASVIGAPNSTSLLSDFSPDVRKPLEAAIETAAQVSHL